MSVVPAEALAAYRRYIERAAFDRRYWTYQFKICQGPVVSLEPGDRVTIGGRPLSITAMAVDEQGVCTVTAEECFDGYSRAAATEDKSTMPQSHADWIEANVPPIGSV